MMTAGLGGPVGLPAQQDVDLLLDPVLVVGRYAFLVHGKPVCLSVSWGSEILTDIVLETLKNQPQSHQYSAVSGVLYALAAESNCFST